MGGIVRNWLYFELGLLVDPETRNFAKQCRNGHLIAQILHKYSIVSTEQLSWIKISNEVYDIDRNFMFLKLWLNAIGISCSDERVSNLKHSTAGAAVQLFFEMYLYLGDKFPMHFCTRKMMREQKLLCTNARFQVERVKEFELPHYTVDSTLEDYLSTNSHITDWKKIKHESILEECKRRREQFRIYLIKFSKRLDVEQKNTSAELVSVSKETGAQDFKNEVGESTFDKNYADCSYEDLVRDVKRIEAMKNFVSRSEDVKKIGKYFKAKIAKKQHQNAAKGEFHKNLLLEMTGMFFQKAKERLEDVIVSKLKKTSLYESAMLGKLLEARQIKRILENERILRNSEHVVCNDIFTQKLFRANDTRCMCRKIFYLEQDKYTHLFKKIYHQKKKLTTERNHKFCRTVVDGLVDNALRNAEYYEKHSVRPEWRITTLWNNFLIKGQSIFDHLENIRDVVYYIDTNEMDPDIKESSRKEILRQNIFAENYLQYYLQHTWVEKIPEMMDFNYLLEDTGPAMQLAGHIIQRLLLNKYPKPSMPVPEGIPNVMVAAAVIGLNDLTILPILKKLFAEKKVKVIQMEDAINFCLTAYKQEDKSRSAYESLNNVTLITQNWLKNKDKRNIDIDGVVWKMDKRQTETSTMDKDRESIFQLPTDDKMVQAVPSMELKLSVSAELGKVALEVLNLGGHIPNRYLVRMFIEYLKSLKDINGWILVNYPETIRQAALLEEALSGKPYIHKNEIRVTVDDFLNLDLRHLNVVSEKDPMAKYRESILFPDIDPPETDVYYEPYLTTFIVMTKDENKKVMDKYCQLYVIEKEQERASLYKLYANSGCYYDFRYEELNFETIKALGKLILKEGENLHGRQPSIEYFGSSVSYLQVTMGGELLSLNKPTIEKVSEKLTKPKERFCFDDDHKINLHNTTANAPRKKEKVLKTKVHIIEVQNKNTQIPEITDLDQDTNIFSKPTSKYLDISIPSSLQTLLASMWKKIEEGYCEDLKNVLFMYNSFIDDQVSFITNIRKVSTVVLKRPDIKQEHIDAFQRYYNDIDDDLRHDEEVKVEIHYKIEELRKTLWAICDDKCEENIKFRNYLIAGIWLARDVVLYADFATPSFQLEVDLCKHTLQLFADYYVAMITKMPCIDLAMDDITLLLFDDMEAAIIYTKACLLFNDIYKPNNVILEHVDRNLEICTSVIANYKQSSLSLLSRIENVIKPKSGKKDNVNRKGTKSLPKFVGPEDEVFINADRILKEWCSLIECVHNRTLYNLHLIKFKVHHEVKNILNYHIETSTFAYNNIMKYHMKEKHAVDVACSVIQSATESEMKLQYRMVVDADCFYIQPDVMLFLDDLPPLESSVKGNSHEFIFTITQLSAITDILMDLVPTGIILERSFAYLLQDIFSHQNDTEWMVPVLWRQMNPAQVSLILQKFFGKVEFVNWKEFIIFNMYLPIPEEQEILDARYEFMKYDPNATETVIIYHYNKVKLWFENCRNEHDHVKLEKLKKLLARLYTVREDTVNYTALLLAFCKDELILKGVVKAFELSLGRLVCSDEVMGKHFAETLVRDELYEGETSHLSNCINEEVKEFSENFLSYNESDRKKVLTKLSSRDLQNEQSDMAYFLPFHSVVAVMSACLLLYINVDSQASIIHSIELIYHQCRNKDMNGGEVLICDFVNNNQFINLFVNNFKFIDKNPTTILTSILGVLNK